MFAVSLVLPLITVLEEGSQKILATAQEFYCPRFSWIIVSTKTGALSCLFHC